LIYRLILIFLLGIPTASARNLLIHNGEIITLEPDRPVVEAVLVREDRILFAGSLEEAKQHSKVEFDEIDLNGNVMYPGFIEAHGHLMSYGFSQLNLDLSDVKNYDELIERVASAASVAEADEWIVGRGWHQSKWTPQPEMVGGFQTHDKLSQATPDNPVYLVHASGHAAMANAKAMELAEITGETSFSEDGEIVKDENGNPTGILNELAQRLVAGKIPSPSHSRRQLALKQALNGLARHGITSFQDAGSGSDDIRMFEEFLSDGQLTARLWLMLSGGDEWLLKRWLGRGPSINRGNHFLTIRAIKLVADGALGSRGAWLLEPYSDAENSVGIPTMTPAYMEDIAMKGAAAGFQIGTHAIGDRANREVLDIYEKVYASFDTDLRFRIEHAQHISTEDIPRFGQLGVIASMQGIHMSSDRPWAIDRLGDKRIKEGAYVWRKLIDTGAVIANGTDVPVEPANPVASFYSLVTRQTLKGQPPGGYEPEQKLTRMEALRSYTIDAAYAAFEEKDKGSIKPGKLADFTVLDTNLMSVPDAEILSARTVMTIVGGKLVYSMPSEP